MFKDLSALLSSILNENVEVTGASENKGYFWVGDGPPTEKDSYPTTNLYYTNSKGQEDYKIFFKETFEDLQAKAVEFLKR